MKKNKVIDSKPAIRYSGRMAEKIKATFYMDRDTLKRLQHEAIDQEKNQSEMLTDMINFFFEKKA